MVTCNILGPGPANNGLGNQLFCIAATLAHSFRHDVEAFFPDLIREPFKKYAATIFHQLASHPSRVDEITKEFNEPPNSSTIHRQIPPHKNLKLNGFFQSYKYFDEFRENILSLFSLPRSLENSIKEEYSCLLENSKTSTSLHVRRGDYVENFSGNFFALGQSYYRAALKAQYNKTIVIFSDDIEWCRKEFTLAGYEFIFVESNCDVTDLYLMSQMACNIIANSTFSWWAAYLNNHKSKKIIYPSLWYGPLRGHRNNNLKDLFPQEWIKINVTNENINYRSNRSRW